MVIKYLVPPCVGILHGPHTSQLIKKTWVALFKKVGNVPRVCFARKQMLQEV